MNINRDNYESFFLLYIDRELKPGDMKGVEEFVRENEDLLKEFEWLQHTVYSPADMVGFQEKELLFRREDKRRIFSFYRAGIAAAALLAIAACWFLVKSGNVFSQNKNQPVRELATAPSIQKNLSPGPYKEKEGNQGSRAAIPDQSGIGKNGENKTASTIGKPRLQREEQSGQAVVVPVNLPSVEDPEESGKEAAPKSTAIELPAFTGDQDIQTRRTVLIAGAAPSTTAVAAINRQPQTVSGEAVVKEQDDHSENAISIVALNDRNAAITGFFKKLIKRAPADEKTKKVNISVFQFSY
jgi:hypothetical protein